MTLVLLIKAAKLAEVHQARNRLGIPRMTVSDLRGRAAVRIRTGDTGSNAI
jgi:nitrogen regulatory protein PII